MAAEFKDLVSYFEQLASEHVEIRHTALDKHFYRFELDEILTGLATGLKFPALILEAYDFNYQESGSDNIRKKRSGAFILIDKVNDRKNFNRIHEVWDAMELIGDDILVRMKKDKESKLIPVLRDFRIEECEGITFAISELGQYGIRFSFNMGSPVSNIVNTDRWL